MASDFGVIYALLKRGSSAYASIPPRLRRVFSTIYSVNVGKLMFLQVACSFQEQVLERQAVIERSFAIFSYRISKSSGEPFLTAVVTAEPEDSNVYLWTRHTLFERSADVGGRLRMSQI